MPDLLLEVGTEEVPATVIVPALEQLRVDLASLLARERIAAGEVRTYGTPRRLVALVAEVAARQADAVVEHRGPPRSAAFDAAGSPTRAAEGFARKHGLAPAELQVRAVPAPGGGAPVEYVFAVRPVQGRGAREVLAEQLPALLQGLAFPKYMRWGEGALRFSRPIRWLVALLGDEVIPCALGTVRAGRETRGHRFLTAPDGSHRVSLAGASGYLEALAAAHVLVDPAARREEILRQGNALAAAAGLRVVWEEALLHDTVFTVEFPTAFMGAFAEEYLQLPRPVLVSAMRKHQRYFTVEHPDGSLAPRFLAFRNGDERDLERVRAGNERVLVFRFNDARHHFEEDRKTTLAEKRERLRRIVFMERLGTMWDKSVRLELLTAALCRHAALSAAETEIALAAAPLCKADLASAMVAELPELQGVIGREYALAEGLPAPVAEAIAEHYQPRAAGDAPPASPAARVLGLADRLDLLAAAFSLGHLPTGSSDPFGLRRAAQGVITLLLHLPPALLLGDALREALAVLHDEPYYREASPLPLARVQEELATLFRTRVEALLEEHGIRQDVREAVLAAGYDCVPATLERARFLEARLHTPGWEAVVAAGTRLRNILKPVAADAALGAAVEAALQEAVRTGSWPLLTHPAERELAAAMAASPALDAPSLEARWEAWSALAPVLDRFFVEVLVNVDDAALRAARLGLLRRLDRSFLALADFSRIAAL